jgi:hypothetical protein
MLTITAFLLMPALLAGADKTPLNVKTGLWQVTVNHTTSGQVGIPPDIAAKLTPQQLAAAEAAMKNRASGPSAPQVYQKCITKDDLIKNAFGNRDKQSCTEKVLKSTASDLELEEACANERGKTDTHLNLHAVDSEHVTGTGHAISDIGGHNMTVDLKFDSKWVGSSCPAGNKGE